MTRETKVGLLVGICVILLIGIIISDQLTVMQQPAPAQFTDAAATAQETLTPLPLSDPSQASMPLTPPPAVREAVVPLPQDLTPPPPQVQTVEQPQAPAQPSDRTTFVDVASNRPVVPDPNGQFHAVNPVSPPNVTLSATDRAGSLTPPGTSPVAAADTLRRQPAPLYHDVATGETLYQIAQRYYGNGETWKIIREANMDKVDAKGNVKLGVRLTIPNKASLVETTTTRTTTITRMPASGGSTVIGAQAPIAADNSGTALRIVQAPAPARTVTVEKGQTLGTLARIHLGSSAKWPDLLAANRDQLKNPQDLKPGMKLRLPGSAAPSPAAAARQRRPEPQRHGQQRRNQGLHRRLGRLALLHRRQDAGRRHAVSQDLRSQP
jgi:nucleoid-associated protein YgaU